MQPEVLLEMHISGLVLKCGALIVLSLQ